MQKADKSFYEEPKYCPTKSPFLIIRNGCCTPYTPPEVSPLNLCKWFLIKQCIQSDNATNNNPQYRFCIYIFLSQAVSIICQLEKNLIHSNGNLLCDTILHAILKQAERVLYLSLSALEITQYYGYSI